MCSLWFCRPYLRPAKPALDQSPPDIFVILGRSPVANRPPQGPRWLKDRRHTCLSLFYFVQEPSQDYRGYLLQIEWDSLNDPSTAQEHADRGG